MCQGRNGCAVLVVKVPIVLVSEYGGIEIRPFHMTPRKRLAAERETVARRTNRHQALAGLEMVLDQSHLSDAQRAPTHAEKEQIRLLEPFQAGKVIRIVLRRCDEGGFNAQWFQLGPGEGRKRLRGLILRFTDQEQDVWFRRRGKAGVA